MLADDPAIQHVSAPVSYLMFHGAYDTPKFRFCSPQPSAFAFTATALRSLEFKPVFVNKAFSVV